jgi:carboxynorspermidine decarboxylase
MDLKKIPSPCFVLEESLLRHNLQIIDRVQQESSAQIILAFKGFAMWSAFPILREYISGATASSLHEAMLCQEEMGTKAHTYAVAYAPREFSKILRCSSHITFNSLSQWRRFGKKVLAYPEKISPGIRVNPGWSPVGTALYNPAEPGSRLGVPIEQFKGAMPEGIEGIHFHTLCESTSHDLEKTLDVFEHQFGAFLPKLQWVNFGGGHLMTKKGYDVNHLITLLKAFKSRYPNLQVILEPGSAFAWETGVLVSTVLDIVNNKGVKTAILDVSFTAHMPDTLEMPYRPGVQGAHADISSGKNLYRLGGVSCLSGDFLAAYAFEKPLKIGQKIVFQDMMHYTMVKTSTFNGVTHPSIAILRTNDKLDVLRRFGYKDYKRRLS